jgi:hypothetical protein
MISENLSLIANEPFIRKFVFSIINNIRARNFVYEERHVIHADLVPRGSERVALASLKEKVTTRENRELKIENRGANVPVVVRSRDMSGLVAPIKIGSRRSEVGGRVVMPPRRMAPPVAPVAQHVVPAAPQGEVAVPSQDYGKIMPLLNDPSVSTIECQGVGKPVMVIRAGQKQVTKIVLTAKEIKEILQKVSDAVHIPLLEGVFRAAVDNFSINAVISEMIGSRFVIKKAGAYALLEGKA